MTHVDEDVFHDAVLATLTRAYGAENVEHEAYLTESDRFVDALVTLAGDHKLAVEIDDTFDGAVGGSGQALLYAGHFVLGQGIVVIPDGHAEHPEREYLARAGFTVEELSELSTVLLG